MEKLFAVVRKLKVTYNSLLTKIQLASKKRKAFTQHFIPQQCSIFLLEIEEPKLLSRKPDTITSISCRVVTINYPDNEAFAFPLRFGNKSDNSV